MMAGDATVMTIVFKFLGIACAATVLSLLAGALLHLPTVVIVFVVVAILIGSYATSG